MIAATISLLWLVTGQFVMSQSAADGTKSTPTATPAQPTQPSVVPAFRQANHVAIIKVHEQIDRVTLYSLTKRIEQAKADGADAVVLDLDTPGGDAYITLDICNLLKEDAPHNTVAWVNHRAFSAGTYMSLACREIVVSPNARMGDAAPIRYSPITGLQPMPPAERAKAEAPLLAEVIDSARRNHYDENLVQSFVSVGIELWLLRNTNTNEFIFVDRGEYKSIFSDEPPTSLTPVTPSAGSVQPWVDRSVPHADADATVMTQQEIDEAIERAQLLPPVRNRLTAVDADKWEVVRQVIADDRLLTVNSDEAVFYGLAQTVIANDDQIKAYFGAQQVTRYDSTWSEGLVRFLTYPVVRGILIFIFVICLFVELAAPGFGVFGTAAFVCLAALIGAPFLIGMAQWWDILLIVIGLLLVLAEIFLIPGTGLAGIGGAVCLLAGLVGVFVSGDAVSSGGSKDEIITGLVTTLTALFAGGVGVWIISRFIHTIPFVNRLVLSAEVSHTAGPPSLLEAMVQTAKPLEVGNIGVAATDLKPVGRIDINGRLVEVRSAGAYIARGSRVRVVNVGPFAIEVEEAAS